MKYKQKVVRRFMWSDINLLPVLPSGQKIEHVAQNDLNKISI